MTTSVGTSGSYSIITPWLLDLCATHHLIGNSSSIDQPILYHGNDQVTVGNGDLLHIINHVHIKL